MNAFSRLLLVIGIWSLVIFCTGCASPRHVSAPSPEKLNAAVSHVESTALEARRSVALARESAQRSVVITGSLKVKVSALLKVTPPELRGQVLDLQSDVLAQEAEQTILTAKITGAEAKQGQLETAIGDLKAEKVLYLAATQKIVDQANADAESWRKDRTALGWYRWHWWGAWLVTLAAAAVWGVFVFLKRTGRAAITLSKPIL